MYKTSIICFCSEECNFNLNACRDPSLLWPPDPRSLLQCQVSDDVSSNGKHTIKTLDKFPNALSCMQKKLDLLSPLENPEICRN